MTWILSRQFEPDEYHATRAAAVSREKTLTDKGVKAVMWEMNDESGPWQETETTEGAA